MQSQAYINDTQEGDQQVIQKHRPTRKKSQVRIESLLGEGVGGAGGRKGGSHPAIAHGSGHHGDHANEISHGDVAVRNKSHDPKYGIRSCGVMKTIP